MTLSTNERARKRGDESAGRFLLTVRILLFTLHHLGDAGVVEPSLDPRVAIPAGDLGQRLREKEVGERKGGRRGEKKNFNKEKKNHGKRSASSFQIFGELRSL